MKRPGLLTALCLFVWIGNAALALFAFRTDWSARGFPAWFAGYSVAIAIVHVVAAVGVWQMRRWGVILTAVGAAVAQSVLLGTQHWTPGSLLVAAVELGVLFKYWPGMR